MFALLAPPAVKLIAGKALANAGRDVAAVGAWLSRRKPIELLCMALAMVIIVQHIGARRYEAKLEGQLQKCASSLEETRTAFDHTVANYRAAAAKAAADDKANAD